MGQGVVPSFFQFGSNQTVLRFRCLILPFDAAGLLARFLKSKLKRSSLLIGLVLALIKSVKSRLNAQRTQGFEDFDDDRLLHARAREGNAGTNHLATAISSTPIARQRPMVLAAGVANLQCASTTTAAQQSG
jgi:hypothetical protein